jgi:hypothetical protein
MLHAFLNIAASLLHIISNGFPSPSRLFLPRELRAFSSLFTWTGRSIYIDDRRGDETYPCARGHVGNDCDRTRSLCCGGNDPCHARNVNRGSIRNDNSCSRNNYGRDKLTAERNMFLAGRRKIDGPSGPGRERLPLRSQFPATYGGFSPLPEQR